MEDWLINYYEQTDPLKRQQMLLENKNETMSEEDKLRMKLWETRYGKGKPRKDMFVGRQKEKACDRSYSWSEFI